MKTNNCRSITPAPFDEKNLTTDWLQDFLFNYNCIANHENYNICGYVTLAGSERLCEVGYTENRATYTFHNEKTVSPKMLSDFQQRLLKYFADNENNTFRIDVGTIDNSIILFFYKED